MTVSLSSSSRTMVMWLCAVAGALRSRRPITKDEVEIALNVNAGLLVDLPHLAESGSDGIGLFRTELQFMISSTFPRLDRQMQFYGQVLDQAGGKPVVFRTLDIGGDKPLPYMRMPEEANPALGWRGLRMSLDRPALLRTQFRALLRAAAGRHLSVMIPMVTAVSEVEAVRRLLDREIELIRQRNAEAPSQIRFGAMVEVPSILHELDALMRQVDFVSVGSNDLVQYLFAADRGNARVGSRYDVLSVAALRALQLVADAARRNDVPATVCGEIAGTPSISHNTP